MTSAAGKQERSSEFWLVSKRFTALTVEINEQLAQKVPTFYLLSPVLEKVPRCFDSPNCYVLRLLQNILYARINPQHSPYNLINIIAEYLFEQNEQLPYRPELVLVRLFLTNQRKELESYIQSSRIAYAADVLAYIQQNYPIIYQGGPFALLIYAVYNKLDSKIAQSLSQDKVNQYLYYLLICLRQRSQYVFYQHQGKFVSMLNHTLYFLQQDTNLDYFLIKIYPLFYNPTEKLVALAILDSATRARYISNLSLYLRCLTEVVSYYSSQYLIECIYLLKSAPYLLRSNAPEYLAYLEQFTFQCLLQSSIVLQHCEPYLTLFAASSKELQTMLYTKLAQMYEYMQQFQLSAHYYKKAGIQQNSVVIKQQILNKIIEIIGFAGEDNYEVAYGIEELERILDAENSEEIRNELILGKDIAYLYRVFYNGSKDGNAGILRLASIILQECYYQDLKQGIMRDLIRFGVLGKQETVVYKFCRNSIAAGDTIQQARAILKHSKYAEHKVTDEDLDIFFETAADTIVNWRLEQNDDDLLVDWMIVQHEAE